VVPACQVDVALGVEARCEAVEFEVMRGEVLRGQYGQNPWQDKNQVVTSIS
jgi:hypothetical protein